MQAAAYVGLRAGGALGAAAAFVGFGLPTFLFMVGLSALYGRTHDLAAVVSAFRGLHVIVIALVVNAALSFGRSAVTRRQDVLLGLGATVFLVAGGSPITAILASSLIGILLFRKLDFRRDTPSSETAGQDSPAPLAAPLLLTAGLALGLLILFILDRKLFDLSRVMLKVDLFAFGGGYASVPLMLHEVVEARDWLDSQTFMDGIALGQVTPGPIVITATFVGYHLAELPGALVGTISVFTPSLIILTAVVPYFDRLQNNSYLQRALHGALISFVGLLAAVAIRFAMAIHWNILEALVAGAAFLALRKKVDILWVVLAGAAVSALIL
jgi:chromate transporter